MLTWKWVVLHSGKCVLVVDDLPRRSWGRVCVYSLTRSCVLIVGEAESSHVAAAVPLSPAQLTSARGPWFVCTHPECSGLLGVSWLLMCLRQPFTCPGEGTKYNSFSAGWMPRIYGTWSLNTLECCFKKKNQIMTTKLDAEMLRGPRADVLLTWQEIRPCWPLDLPCLEANSVYFQTS